MKELKFAPREVFEQILKYAVIPTFDLVLEYGDMGVILVKRKIAPYESKWALPGLRIFKPESIEDTIRRIAKQEVGLDVDPDKRLFLGQYVGRFKTEYGRQDLSTGYYLKVSDDSKIVLNKDHFSSYKLTKTVLPNMGAMYKFFFKKYLELKNNH